MQVAGAVIALQPLGHRRILVLEIEERMCWTDGLSSPPFASNAKDGAPPWVFSASGLYSRRKVGHPPRPIPEIEVSKTTISGPFLLSPGTIPQS